MRRHVPAKLNIEDGLESEFIHESFVAIQDSSQFLPVQQLGSKFNYTKWVHSGHYLSAAEISPAMFIIILFIYFCCTEISDPIPQQLNSSFSSRYVGGYPYLLYNLLRISRIEQGEGRVREFVLCECLFVCQEVVAGSSIQSATLAGVWLSASAYSYLFMDARQGRASPSGTGPHTPVWTGLLLVLQQ